MIERHYSLTGLLRIKRWSLIGWGAFSVVLGAASLAVYWGAEEKRTEEFLFGQLASRPTESPLVRVVRFSDPLPITPVATATPNPRIGELRIGADATAVVRIGRMAQTDTQKK